MALFAPLPSGHFGSVWIEERVNMLAYSGANHFHGHGRTPPHPEHHYRCFGTSFSQKIFEQIPADSAFHSAFWMHVMPGDLLAVSGGEGAHMFKAHGICNKCEEAVQYHNLPSLFERVLSLMARSRTTSFTQNIAVGPSSAADIFVDPVGGWGSTTRS